MFPEYVKSKTNFQSLTNHRIRIPTSCKNYRNWTGFVLWKYLAYNIPNPSCILPPPSLSKVKIKIHRNKDNPSLNYNILQMVKALQYACSHLILMYWQSWFWISTRHQRHQLRGGRQTPILSPTQILTFPTSALQRLCLISIGSKSWAKLSPAQSGFMLKVTLELALLDLFPFQACIWLLKETFLFHSENTLKTLRACP